ncbi:MAG: UDP-N-acetylmuramoyl-tripeptide--D-alanyl-D-alanine ligase [Oscillospiraceae bacterium]|nr:UDP-N-acetylmuramoyl-tripeptide--D-alanyl-D-alanine ligase [Oscillospiraceae bacterium]
MKMTVKEILAAVHGTLLQGDEDTVVTKISTDSRKMEAGSLFLPWRGERFDGHDFIASAMENGAAGCMTAVVPATLCAGKFYIKVEDTRVALKELAAAYRSRFDIPFVQITGSTGKTTAKEMIAIVLSQKYNTLKTIGNFNGDLGTPMILMDLNEQHEAAVIETGMDNFGQIRWLGEAVRPHYAVIINIGVAHMEYLGSREGILRAKSEIFEKLDTDGIAVLNGDDELLNTVEIPQKILRCGMSEHCNVRIADVVDRGVCGMSCTIRTEKNAYAVEIPAPGIHMCYAAAYAAAIAEQMGLGAEEIVRGIAAYVPAGDRMRVERLAGERVMLNDSYNANPQSMAGAVKILANAGEMTKIAMLGDMKELGGAEQEGHEEIGRLVAELGIDHLFCVGTLCRDYMAPAAKKAGCKDVRWYESKEDAWEELLDVYVPGSVLLLKASHFSGRFDQVADRLREHTF